MLNIVFDPAFDRGSWPGPLHGRSAVSGELWTGPLGLLGVLETMTGLRRPQTPHSLRAAELIPALRSTDGFWSASTEVDPLGAANEVLQWADFLRSHGWQGQGKSPRLRQLDAVTQNAMPGIPERLFHATQALCAANNDIATLVLREPAEDLPWMLRQAISSLHATGTVVEEQPVVPVQARGDLARAREAMTSHQELIPQGDGSLLLLRPQTSSEAAHEVAAWLSGQDNLKDTLIIGSDRTLDKALHRFGLPTTGAGISVYDNALLQILPLTLEMAWQPPDPQRALELLTLPVSPVPRSIAFSLIRALHEYPAVGSEAWNMALKEKLEAIDDPDRRQRLQERIASIFSASLPGPTYPTKEVLARIDFLRSWARGRMQEEDGGLDWTPVIAQLENAQRLVRVSGMQEFTAPQLKRLVFDVTQEIEQLPLFPEQAGISWVRDPESVVERAGTIIWWSFQRAAASSVIQDPFSQAERQDLAAAGVLLPDPGWQAEHNARRWQRPLALAANRLLVVCPKQASDGEDASPHPLWDELEGRLKDKALLGLLQQREITDQAKPCRSTRAHAALPRPVSLWQVNDSALLPARDTESPNSLAKLLACPFQWVTTYLGRLSGGFTATLPEPDNLEGWFVHAVAAKVLEEGIATPQEAAEKAQRVFEELGPKLAAQFFLPGFDHFRAQVQNTTKNAVQELYGLINRCGFQIEGVEPTYTQPIPSLGITLQGTPDLVLKKPLAVLDMKRGGEKYREAELKNGTSVQLAVYSRLLRNTPKTSFPPAAYFMLKAGRLSTISPAEFGQDIGVEGVCLEETWEAIKNGYTQTRQEMHQGEVRAPGNAPERLKESAIVDDRLCLKPCAFCDLHIVCGQAFGEN